ncbi:hypothetical protein HNY73_016573 [Argiope bruennichi]|uniref:Uncharacterized protein n=1 Tax=Argiope bruennichi TaxID=94029 RepID=A0A8T0EK47_ARGBR|nr:hypothetical protein HNY73_016573 [Argiope bruennichi]
MKYLGNLANICIDLDVSIPSEQSAEEGLDKHFLADAASMQLMGVNGLGQTITTISRPPRQKKCIISLDMKMKDL